MQSQIVKIYDVQSLVKDVAPNMWQVEQAFSQPTLDWMQNIILNDANRFQVSRPHFRLLLEPGPDHDRLQQVGRDLIPALSQITGNSLNLMVAKFWVDLSAFACQVHADAPEILVSYQVYIDVMHHPSVGPCHGVKFLHVTPSVEIPLVPNFGYINLNTDAKLHEVEPGWGTRISVIFQYNLV